ncbi:ABC transporter FUM19 [Colletotrichum gloeosporioides]|uniref:ABC transporter FUM19 n=2 Tax=Colletotrichum gloeosporioides TaxID=474922 RepID=A0A8H4CVA6_COLGL|nr:ABC transporter FUM19 [Colletotrichum gloeosporioides]KAF3810805.1 ABC transporter FUM19 [Colletotrichum gloeosporioides]
MSCPSLSDQSFGPRVHPECRSFDFTLQFEDILFACIPSAVFILLAPTRIVHLLRQPTAFAVRSWLLLAKLVILAALLASHLAFLALRSQTPNFQTSASVAADVLILIAILTIGPISLLTHQRSPRPSTLLSIYLSASTILGIARVRTAWLLGQQVPVPALATAVLVLMIALLIVESIASKKRQSEPELSHSKLPNPEQTSGFWARTCFWWLAHTFSLGYSRVLSLVDLPNLDIVLESRHLHRDLSIAWNSTTSPDDQQRKNSLLKACIKSYFLSFLSPVIPRLCLSVFTFAHPFLINTTVSFVGQEKPDNNFGKGLIGAWALVYLGIAVSNSIFQYQNLRFTTRLRGGLVALIYQQAINTREADTGDITAVALMGTDVERIHMSMSVFHLLWSSLLDIIIASWLLGLQLSLACLAPIILVLAFIAAMSKVSVATNTAQKHWIEKIQERLRVTTTMLSEMKAVKMLGLTQVMSNTVQNHRTNEIETSKSFRKFLALSPINLAPIVTFGIYVIISVYWKNDTLLPAQTFTSIALISLLTTPVVAFIQILPMVVQSLSCFDRIQDFCNYSSPRKTKDQPVNSFSSSSQTALPARKGPKELSQSSHPSQEPILSFSGESFGWKEDQSLLHEINVQIQPNTVTSIVGPVGSGKSNLLSAMLGNMIRTSPMMTNRCGNERGCSKEIAYCSQTPWLENGTIRQNILGVSAYEEKWYDTVALACGLEPDFQALKMGDFTLVGSQGSNLSGGQKQRIALARAVYARKRIVILDDIFSGMDARTAHHVSTYSIGRDGLLRRQRASVIFATHSHRIMGLADSIISLDGGRVQEIGSPMDLVQGQGYVSKLGLMLSPNEDVANDSSSSVEPEVSEKHQGETSEMENPREQKHTDVRRKNGEKAVYLYYLKSAGWKAIVMYTAAVTSWAFFSEFSTVWIKWWSESNSSNANQDVGYVMGIYALFGVLGTLNSSIAAWFAFIDIISNTALKLHSDLLQTTVSATFAFFSKTDNGEILNRFSEDMQLLDMDLPSNLLNYTSTGVTILAKVIILVVFSQYLGATLPFLCAILYLLQRFYLQTSRQVRLLGIEAKAPLYTHFSESVAGVATIRAFGWQEQYQERNYEHVDESQRPSYTQGCIQAWLTFVLNLIVAVLAVVLVIIVVTWHHKFSAGNVGVSLVMIIGFSEVLARLIQSWTKLESSIGAVARVRRFVSDTETESAAERGTPPVNWPQAGAVKFSDVVASYGSDASPVLKKLSLAVEGGQHVAICGRSGSGKTSLIMTLLQMTNMKDGRIDIDGVDVSTLLQSELRACINVIPQDPFLMPGTVRFNLNPYGNSLDDDRLVEALGRVGVWSLVQDQGGLDAEMNVNAWSAGQKQLLCLARAMLRQSKILILDEAMSSVDSETEAIMQDIVDSDFRDCTVLAVMHRLKHVTHYDKVALLGDGKLLEYDTPESLISGETQFAEMFKMKAN